jgi:magnesium-transporting ATPase (P-type)
MKNISPHKISLVFILSFLLVPIVLSAHGLAAHSENHLAECGNIAAECLSSNIFLETMFFMFIALVIWTISPIGILFFLTARPLFSKNSSALIKKAAWAGQGIAFLMWLSAMTLLFIVYLDSIFYNILNLGGKVLSFALVSGLAFAFVMFVIIMLEKKSINSEKKQEEKQKEKSKQDKSKQDRKRNDSSIKIAGIELKGIKKKVKGKLKEDLKEIIDDEIDRRL